MPSFNDLPVGAVFDAVTDRVCKRYKKTAADIAVALDGTYEGLFFLSAPVVEIPQGDTINGPSLDPQPGDVVRHYKGGVYLVIERPPNVFVETDGSPAVAYTHWGEEDEASLKKGVPVDVHIDRVRWIRGLKSWRESHDYGVPRFVLLGRKKHSFSTLSLAEESEFRKSLETIDASVKTLLARLDR